MDNLLYLIDTPSKGALNMFHSRIATAIFSLMLAIIFFGSTLGYAQKKDEPPELPPIAANQARLVQTFEGLDGPGFAIAVSDAAGMVAAACDRSTIQLWHKDTILGIRAGSNSANILSGHVGTVTALAWNGGPVLASAAADKKILLWEVASGKILHELESAFLVRSLAMSPDGKLLASAGDHPEVHLWDVASGKIAKQLKGHSDWLTCVAFSHDGKQLASGGYEGEAFLWEAGNGQRVRVLPAPPSKKPKTPPETVPVTGVAFHPDGKQAAIGRADSTIDLVNVANGQKIRTLTGHKSGITKLVYHPSGSLLVSSSKDSTLRLWNPANGGLFKSLDDHEAWVEDVAFIARGTRLVSVGADRTVRVWNLTAP